MGDEKEKPNQKEVNAQVPIVVDLGYVYSKLAAIENDMDMPVKQINDHAMAINNHEERLKAIEGFLNQIIEQQKVQQPQPVQQPVPQEGTTMPVEEAKKKGLFGRIK